MNFKIIKILIGIIFSMSFISCTKEIEIDIPEQEPVLVLNSFISPDQNISVYLTETIGAFETVFPDITNANVVLFCDKNPIDTLKYIGENIYISNEIPQVGHEYEIIAKTSDHKIVSGKTTIPERNQIDEIKRIENYNTDIYGNSNSLLEISFMDNAQTKDYYEIILSYDSLYTTFGPDTVMLHGIANVFCDNPIILSEIEDGTDAYGFNPNLFFSDDLFNGKQIKLSILYKTIGSSVQTEDYTLNVYLNNVSPDYYNYIKTRYYLNLYSQDLLNNTGEVIRLYSNVNGGYGIFAGLNTCQITLKP